jgi:hypothetical protein
MKNKMDYYAKKDIHWIGYCLASGAFLDLLLYGQSKQSWDPNLDMEALVDEFMAGYYGAAAKPMREYLTYYHRHTVHTYCEAGRMMMVTPEYADAVLEILSRAQDAAADEPDCLSRVDLEKFYVLWSFVQADPHHLIASNRHNLGGVDHWLPHVDLCASYDLVAVNFYPDNQSPGVGANGLAVLREVGRRSGRPVIIGEWSVPAMDSGLYEQRKAVLDWSFPQAVPTQAIRARQAARVTADFFNEPYIVGAHWFIYDDFDSPKREANRGLVRGDGQPWDELIRQLTAVHREIDAHLGRSARLQR